MLYVIAAVLAWFPAVQGLGYLTLHLLDAEPRPTSRNHPAVFTTVVGLAILGTFANVLNFLLPISPSVALTLLLGGWLALLGTLWSRKLRMPSPRQLVAAAGILCYIAFAGREFVWWTQDSGLYHVPTIAWLTDNRVVLGLGNLHGRLAFNQLWFSTAAAMETFLLEGKSSFILSAILLYGWGLSLLGTLASAASKGIIRSDLFFLLTGMVWINLVNGARLNSPSPDLPTLVLAILCTFAATKATESPEDWAYYTMLTAITAVVAIMIKLSALPLLLFPLLLTVWKLRAGRQTNNRSWFFGMAVRMGVATLFMSIPWFLRGIALSGCLIYPLSVTRLPWLDWAIPVQQIDMEASWIRSWARQPGHAPEVVLANWDWLWAWWLPRYAFDRVIVATLGMLLVGGAASAITWRARPLSLEVLLRHGLLFMAPAIGLVFWFATAPDLRFGEGYFWAIGLLALSAGLHRLYHVYLSIKLVRLAPPIRLASLVLGMLIVIAATAPWRARYWVANYQEVLDRVPELVFQVPALPVPEMDTGTTREGMVVYRPRVLGLCWDGPRPCTPFFDEKLRAIREVDGSFDKFYFPGRG